MILLSVHLTSVSDGVGVLFVEWEKRREVEGLAAEDAVLNRESSVRKTRVIVDEMKVRVESINPGQSGVVGKENEVTETSDRETIEREAERSGWHMVAS